MPLTKYDPRVLKTIPKVLPDLSDDLAQKGNQLISQLGSMAFDEREAAEKELVENFGAFATIISRELSDDDLDSEIRLRLVRVQELAGYDQSEAERYIQEGKLLEDADYLDSVLPELPTAAQQIVQEHIERLRKRK